MKKLLAIFVIVVLFTSACSAPENMESNSSSPNGETLGIVDSYDVTNISYGSISADWPSYHDTQALIDNSTAVVLGKVTNISFQMLDTRTARPITDETDAWNRGLNTMYEIDVLEQYKGSSLGSSTQVRMLGGLKEIYLKEQITILGEDAKNGIPILDDMPEISIGETYLFVLYQYEDTAPTLLNVEHGVFDLENPETNVLSSSISAKDVISYFGEERWTAFQQIYHTINEMD